VSDAAPDLPTLQRWMSILVRHHGNAETAAASDAAQALIPQAALLAGSIVAPSATMTPTERIQVYNGGYLSRLLEVLESDFDAIKYVIGEQAWFELGRDFVEEHPSQHPNLNHFGKHMPDFIAAQTELPHRAFLADLARLEQAVVQAFDSPEFEPFDLQQLQSLTEDQWPEVRFVLNPSVQLRTFDYPVNRFLQDYFDDKAPEVPAAEPVSMMVYRKRGRVWRVRLPDPIYAIAAAIAGGQPFGEAVTAGGAHEENVMRWFQEWSAEGVFQDAIVP